MPPVAQILDLTQHTSPPGPSAAVRADSEAVRQPGGAGGEPLTIGIVAPPWVPVPPPAYGGIELMVDALARGLQARGHRVRLFTVGTSTCPVELAWTLDEPPARIGSNLEGLSHALAAYEVLDDCDIIHDHTLAGVALASTGRVGVPVVTTNHGPFSDDLVELYRRTAHQVPLISISADQASRAPREVPVATVIHHGVRHEVAQFERVCLLGGVMTGFG